MDQFMYSIKHSHQYRRLLLPKQTSFRRESPWSRRPKLQKLLQKKQKHLRMHMKYQLPTFKRGSLTIKRRTMKVLMSSRRPRRKKQLHINRSIIVNHLLLCNHLTKLRRSSLQRYTKPSLHSRTFVLYRNLLKIRRDSLRRHQVEPHLTLARPGRSEKWPTLASTATAQLGKTRIS